jgi:hypothetical protein
VMLNECDVLGCLIGSFKLCYLLLGDGIVEDEI